MYFNTFFFLFWGKNLISGNLLYLSYYFFQFETNKSLKVMYFDSIFKTIKIFNRSIDEKQIFKITYELYFIILVCCKNP